MKRIVVFLVIALISVSASAQKYELTVNKQSVTVLHKDKDGKFNGEQVVALRAKLPELVEKQCGDRDCERYREMLIERKLKQENLPVGEVKVKLNKK